MTRTPNSLPSAAHLPTVCVVAMLATVGTAACSLEHRPAWERQALPAADPAVSRSPPAASSGSGTRGSRSPAGVAAGAGGTLRSAALTQPLDGGVDPRWIGFVIQTARHQDTLLDLAVTHGSGFLEVAIANPRVDPWLPGAGTAIVLPTLHLQPEAPHQGIVIDLPEQRLYHYEGVALERSYPIGIGRDGHATPIGSTTVVRKQANPTWYPVPASRLEDPSLPAAMPPGPDNPLGTRAMYLGWSSYLIHGTNKDYGIGRRASRGCIRMYTPDVEALFDKVPVGTPVTVVDQPVKAAWMNGELYIQASPTMAQVRQWEAEGRFDRADPAAAQALVAGKAGDDLARVDWAAVERALVERRGIVTRVTGPARLPAPTIARAPVPVGVAAPAAPLGASGASAAAVTFPSTATRSDDATAMEPLPPPTAAAAARPSATAATPTASTSNLAGGMAAQAPDGRRRASVMRMVPP